MRIKEKRFTSECIKFNTEIRYISHIKFLKSKVRWEGAPSLLMMFPFMCRMLQFSSLSYSLLLARKREAINLNGKFGKNKMTMFRSAASLFVMFGKRCLQGALCSPRCFQVLPTASYSIWGGPLQPSICCAAWSR